MTWYKELSKRSRERLTSLSPSEVSATKVDRDKFKMDEVADDVVCIIEKGEQFILISLAEYLLGKMTVLVFSELEGLGLPAELKPVKLYDDVFVIGFKLGS